MPPDARAELALVARLRSHGARISEASFHVTAGVTTEEQRKERMRAAIKDNGLSEVVCANKGGKPVLYRDAFKWLYGEELETPA